MLPDELARAQQALEAANALEDINERRRQSAVPLRDLRYYAARVRTAQLMPAPPPNEVMAFGHTVTFEPHPDLSELSARTRPTYLKLPYRTAHRIALALIGKRVSDVVQLGQRELEIVSIS